jgi:hypothetical protein
MKSFWWAGIALALWGGEAAAQVSGHSTSTPATNVRPYKELQSFGTCLAKAQRKAALSLIATVAGSGEERKILRKLVYGEHAGCLFGGTQMQMPDIFARGAVAEGLLRSGGVPAEYQLAAPSPTEVRDLHGGARCYTSGHRDDAEKLLQTTPGSPEELKAVGGLWEDFRTCIPKFNVRLNAPWIRFLLAEAVLRLAPNTTSSGG